MSVLLTPKNTGFDKFHFFSQNYQNQGQSTEGKEKKEKIKNGDKKMKQILLNTYFR